MLVQSVFCCHPSSMGNRHSYNPVNNDRLNNGNPTLDMLSERPTFEEVKQWAECFDYLMEHSTGRLIFGEFLKREFADENILFWQACEELKKETDVEKISEKARIIYEDFISILSPKEVSLDSRVREAINDRMLQPTAATFDDAQQQIYTLMQRDSYPRFLQSKFYRDLLSTFTEMEDL